MLIRSKWPTKHSRAERLLPTIEYRQQLLRLKMSEVPKMSDSEIGPTKRPVMSDKTWYVRQNRSKTAKMQKFPIDSHSDENFISHFFRPPRAAKPQKGRRHIRNQSTPACKLWHESARGLSRNRWQKKRTNKTTYSKTNTSPFALTSEWRVTRQSLKTNLPLNTHSAVEMLRCINIDIETILAWKLAHTIDRRQLWENQSVTQKNQLGFCRATRMHSADYAVAKNVCLSVCLSVRPSVRHTPVLSLNGYTYPQSFFTVW